MALMPNKFVSSIVVNMLDVTRLRVLVAVARHGSVTAAARELNYAQPSVSHHLARLEAETGVRLIQRAGRGIRLTDAGRLLADRATEVLGRLDAAENELAAHAGLSAGRVRLAAFPSALGTIVPAAAAMLRAEYPGDGRPAHRGRAAGGAAHAARGLRRRRARFPVRPEAGAGGGRSRGLPCGGLPCGSLPWRSRSCEADSLREPILREPILREPILREPILRGPVLRRRRARQGRSARKLAAWRVRRVREQAWELATPSPGRRRPRAGKTGPGDASCWTSPCTW